jgi:hypothetical protein
MTAKKVIAVVMLLLLACPLTLSQRKAGINSAAFLKVGVGARSVGMGSSVTTLRGDVEQMFYNPAGIATTGEQIQASFSYANWLAGIKHSVGAISYNWEDIGTIGVGLIMFGDNNIPATRDPFNDQSTSSTFDYMDMALQVSFARYVTDRLSLGITAKYINESIDDLSASAVAFDVGSLYDIGLLDWRVGARLSNVGSDIKYYDFSSPIPITFSMGTSLMPLNTEDQKWLVSVDVVKQQDYLPYFNVGMEYTVLNMLMVRGGYKLNYSDVEDPGRTNRNPIQTSIEGWSLGGGVRTSFSDLDLRIDYAFTDMKILNDVHRFSIHIGWK